MALLAAVDRLTLRATQGLLTSVRTLRKVQLPVPAYTTWCRRRRQLAVSLPRRAKDAPLHVVVDATGIKGYGEGEWQLRSHGWSKRRTWRQLHLGVEAAGGELVAATVTTDDLSDGQLLPALLDQLDADSAQVSAAGADATRVYYAALDACAAQAALPPRRGARAALRDTQRCSSAALHRMPPLGMPDSYAV